MTPLLRIALCCTLVVSSSIAFAADNNMTPEERTVRMAYAKLIFAVEVQSIEQALRQNHRRFNSVALENALRKNQLQIELSGFSVGDIAEIANRNIQDLVPLPHGEEVLFISGVNDTFKDEDGKMTEDYGAGIPSWQPGPGGSIGQKDVYYTLAEVLAVNQSTDIIDRYAAFNVALSFQGVTRKYKALALFGKSAKGADEVLFTDTVLGGSPQDMTMHSMYPAVLLQTSRGQVPAVVDWFQNNQVPATSCTTGARDACCDLSALKCGISAADLKTSPAYVAVRGQTPGN